MDEGSLARGWLGEGMMDGWARHVCRVHPALDDNVNDTPGLLRMNLFSFEIVGARLSGVPEGEGTWHKCLRR